MFERFTDEARHAVVAAQTEARKLEATRIETIHLFLGVLGTAGPELTEVLSAEGYTRESDDAFTSVVREPEHLKKKVEALVCLA